MSARVRNIKVWVNAFIPAHIPGYTTDILSGEHQGQTMILGPPGPAGSFLTDQRSFENATDAQSQMHSAGSIKFNAPKPQLTQWHECQFTTQLRGDDQQQLISDERESGDASRMKFTLLPHPALVRNPEALRLMRTAPRRSGPSAPVDKRTYLFVDCRASFVSEKLANHFGDLHCRGLVTIDMVAKTADFNGQVGRFPAYEMYFSINDAPGVPIFRLSPQRGRTALEKTGSALRVIKGSATFE